MKVEVLIVRFDIVSDYKDKDINLPTRATADSAGYDFEVAEDTVVPSWNNAINRKIQMGMLPIMSGAVSLSTIEKITKDTKLRPTLVPTGIKAYLDEGKYLELSVRSSCPLKYGLLLANGEGIIDRDYVDNESNEGEIFFQLINLSPYDIQLKKGDKIGQGIIKTYDKVEGDMATAKRTGGFGSSNG